MESPVVLNLACIVEGKGDVGAMRVLLDRLSLESNDRFWVNMVKNPLRTKKHRLIKKNDNRELDRSVGLAALNLRDCGSPKGILILIDADDDCPADLGPELLARAKAMRSDIPIAVVLAKSEFESWLLAGVEGLAGRHGFPENLPPMENPESIRDAKGKLAQLRGSLGVFKATADQASLTSFFCLESARQRSPSFQKFCRELDKLLK